MNLDELIARQKALMALADAEHRALSEDERSEFDMLQRCVQALTITENANTRSLPDDKTEDKEPENKPDDNSEGKTEDKEPENKPDDKEQDKVTGNKRSLADLKEIQTICSNAGIDPMGPILSGASVAHTRRLALDAMRDKKAPLPGIPHVIEDARAKFRNLASDALLLRAGVELEKPAEGAREMQHRRLRDLAIECLEQDGLGQHTVLSRESDDRLWGRLTRAFFNPESAFATILDRTIEKAYLEMYRKVPVTYPRFTAKGSLPDLAIHDNYYMQGPVGEFQKVPETGELKHDVFSDAKRPQRELETYGIQFTISRKAFINDDIGLVASVPRRYAESARKTINKQVYQALLGDGPIYDGAKLFCGAHNNLLAAGTGVTLDALQTMIMALANQKDEFGDPIMITPAKIVGPVGLRFEAYTLFNSPVIQTEDNTQAANPIYPYRSSIEVIEDPTINALCGDDAVMPWFLIGSPADAPFIQIDYLNGQETPNIRRSETSGQLGFIYDMWLDWKVTVMDFRAAVKNPGMKFKPRSELAK